MANEKPPDRRGAPPDASSDVQITVTFARPDRGHLIRQRLAGIRVPTAVRGILALALGVAALGAIVAGALEADRTGVSGGARAAQARDVGSGAAGAAGVAAAYGFGYPFRCLSITISASNPAFARAHVDRSGACARYHGYVNASFHRIGGVWRLVLDEGQLFVPNALLTGCRARTAGCPPGRAGQRDGY